MQFHLACWLRILLVVLLTVACLVTAGSVSRAQSSQKPELKDFGSSLKKLKWDPDKQTMVETGRPAKPRGGTSDVDVVKVQTDLISLDVQVTDRQGRFVTGLTKDDFIVTDDAQPQTIGHFSLGSDQTVGRSIVLILDYSGSLKKYLKNSIDAAEILIERLGPRDRLAIVTDDVKLISDFTHDAKKLKHALESLRKKADAHKFGLSYQLTALMATARELFDEEDVRPIVIFQTDGDEVGLLQPPDPRFYFLPVLPENGSGPPQKDERTAWLLRATIDPHFQIKPYSLADVYKAVERSRATVYTIIPGQQLVGIPPEEQYARVKAVASRAYSANQVKEMTSVFVRAQAAAVGAAAVSGGWTAFLNKPEDAPDIYSSILTDINGRYVLGYYPTNKLHDGRRRTVSVKVRGHDEYVISGRRSYYAPEPEPEP